MTTDDIDMKALECAADKLDEIGIHHGWWKPQSKSWRELDEIGREEFLDVVWAVVNSYKKNVSSGAEQTGSGTVANNSRKDEG